MIVLLTTFISIIVLIFSKSNILDALASLMLAPTIVMVFAINIYTWKEDPPDQTTFNKLVGQDLNEMFKKLNDYYKKNTNQGVKWATVEGHYWVEIHINEAKRINELMGNKPKYVEQVNANLDFILSLANVSGRGKDMLLKDIMKMQERSISDIKLEEE